MSSFKYCISEKYEISSSIKIVNSFEAQPKHMYNIVINYIDRILYPA